MEILALDFGEAKLAESKAPAEEVIRREGEKAKESLARS